MILESAQTVQTTSRNHLGKAAAAVPDERGFGKGGMQIGGGFFFLLLPSLSSRSLSLSPNAEMASPGPCHIRTGP